MFGPQMVPLPKEAWRVKVKVLMEVIKEGMVRGVMLEEGEEGKETGMNEKEEEEGVRILRNVWVREWKHWVWRISSQEGH